MLIPQRKNELGNEQCNMFREDRSRYKIYPEAFWNDKCGHGKKAYKGSFISEDCKYDVYLFTDHRRESVCARYGNAGPEYLSPGSVESIADTVASFPVGTSPTYEKILRLLGRNGQG